MQRSFGEKTDVSSIVRDIVTNVKQRGDSVILAKYQKHYGKTYVLKVTKSEIENAYKSLDKSVINALKQAIKNISTVCTYEKSSLPSTTCAVTSGVKVWREWRPIEKVGLYIPGGKAVYPSSVLMTGIPAKIAGCKEIVICTPPDMTGKIPSPTLVAADMIGIKDIYKVGGAEAIAGMAYGTSSIPKVYKIFGAGNSFVTEAKMQVFGEVNIDMPAGPSEVLIIADETANPAFTAADLLADGEHGEDSACVLITTSEYVAKQTIIQIDKQLEELATAPRIRESLRRYGLIAVCNSLEDAIRFCNDYAPEHLEIMTKNPEAVVKEINNAGSVFLGQWTTKSSGDYATGANHVLPTGGMAKMFPPLSVDAFGKLMQVQKVISRDALQTIRKTIVVLGEIEQLPAHKNATTIRFKRGDA